MRNSLIAAVAVLALSALYGCGGGGSSATYQFTFNPDDSVSFTVDFTKSRITKMGDQSMSDSSWSRTSQNIVADGDGYRSVRVTDSMVQFRDGARIEDRILDLFARTPITYVLDSLGEARDVVGYEELFGRLDSILGSDTAAMLRQVINPDVLKAQEIATWNERFVPFTGTTMKIGEPSIDTSYINLPVEGPVVQYQLLELVDTVRVDGQLCGKVNIVSGTNPTELAEMTGRTPEEMAKLLSITEEQVEIAANRQASTGSIRSWVVEFETLLSHSEESKFAVFYNELTESGTMVRSEITETQRKDYSYSTQ